MTQNVNHWNASSPGNFTVSIATSDASAFLPLATLPNNDDPNLTYYNVTVIVPYSIPTGHAVVQTVYYASNLSAPLAFYQCADVYVISSPASSSASMVRGVRMMRQYMCAGTTSARSMDRLQ